jgi:hypothetical protein
VQAKLPQPGSGFEPGCRVSARAALPSKLMILVEEQTRIESTEVIAERSRTRCSVRRGVSLGRRRGGRPSSAFSDGVDTPGARDALELVLSAINEVEARASDEVLYGLRDEHLAGVGERCDPCLRRRP